MFCVNCGNEVKEGDKFCDKCGMQLQTDRAVSMSFAENKQRKRRGRTGLLIGAIITAGAVLLIALLIILSVYRNKANDTLDRWRQRYENSYTPGTDRNYEHHDEYGEHHSF